jgi:Vitamin K-dependent gamma-carboxylase
MTSFLLAWNEFWFRPRTSHSLAIIRIATGFMLAYIHLIWLLRIEDFFGKESLIDNELSRRLHTRDFAWTYFWNIESIGMLSTHQVLAIAVSLCVAIGLLTRLTAPLAWFMTLMVCHRMTGFLFGLDQVVMWLSMYLILAPSGSLWSVDSLVAKGLRNRPTGSWIGCLFPSSDPSSMTTVATRLMQIHLCIVYLFGGLEKLRGEMWWDGSAMWFSAVAFEYQSMDLTWLGRWPILAALATHLTVFWETFYCFLIWQPRCRPIMLGIAVAVHGGIGLFLGMITFGFMMIVANIAFVEPEWVQRICAFCSGKSKSQ